MTSMVKLGLKNWLRDGSRVRQGKYLHRASGSQPGSSTDEFSTLPDTYNTVQPAQSLTTAAFRIVMKPRHGDTCVGLLAVDVEAAK